MKSKILVINKSNILVKYADSFFARLKGLMFAKSLPQNQALLITKCNQIHTYNMNFPIDAVYINKSGRVVYVESNIIPGKICQKQPQADVIMELNAHEADKIGIKPNINILF